MMNDERPESSRVDGVVEQATLVISYLLFLPMLKFLRAFTTSVVPGKTDRALLDVAVTFALLLSTGNKSLLFGATGSAAGLAKLRQADLLFGGQIIIACW